MVCSFVRKQGRAKPSNIIMGNEKIIIQELNHIADVVIKPEDKERWAHAMEILSKRLDFANMDDEAQESLQQLIDYNGSDFVFDRSTAPVAPGTIVYFKLGNMTPSIPAYVHARHEYSGKWKYDLTFAIKEEDGWHITRIYNIESRYLQVIK